MFGNQLLHLIILNTLHSKTITTYGYSFIIDSWAFGKIDETLVDTYIRQNKDVGNGGGGGGCLQKRA